MNVTLPYKTAPTTAEAAAKLAALVAEADSERLKAVARYEMAELHEEWDKAINGAAVALTAEARVRALVAAWEIVTGESWPSE